MIAFQLRKGARSTRIYCSKYYAVLGVDYPNYFTSVFMFFRNHCETNFGLPENPDTAIFFDDLPVPDRHLIPSNVPLFYSFPRDREKFRCINSVVETFKVASHPPKGQTFKDLINSLGKIKIHDLQQGERLQAWK